MAKKQTVKKSPLTKARDKYLKSFECKLLEPSAGHYLRNRLERAFISGYTAGWDAHEKEVKNEH